MNGYSARLAACPSGTLLGDGTSSRGLRGLGSWSGRALERVEVENLGRSGRSSCGADGNGVWPEVHALEDATELLAVVDDGDEAEARLAAGASKNRVLPVLGSLRSPCARCPRLQAKGAEHQASPGGVVMSGAGARRCGDEACAGTPK
jgi:hypothetical protein